MDRRQECVCCQEVEKIKALNVCSVEMGEVESEPTCITLHPGFRAVCLNKYVLRTAWYQYRQQYGTNGYEGPEHKQNMHIAYRQLVRWCWVVLGKEIIKGGIAVLCCIMYMCSLSSTWTRRWLWVHRFPLCRWVGSYIFLVIYNNPVNSNLQGNNNNNKKFELLGVLNMPRVKLQGETVLLQVITWFE